MTICEEIGIWAAGLTLADIPDRVVERARIQTANTLAAGAAGAAMAEPFRAAAPEGPVGEVYMGAASSIAHDWDDYLYMGHTGHSAVWASRAFAGGDADRALTAQIAANEISGRIGVALFFGPHNGQFWSSIHCAGAAVAAGIGLGLDAAALAHAAAISLYQPPYGLWPGFMGPKTKLLTAAEPAMQGARAALLAEAGVEGPLDVIESPKGMLTHLSFAPRPGVLGEWGRVWLTDSLAYKPVPGCAYLQAAVDAALRAELAPADVASIEVEGGYLTCGMEALGAGPDLAPVRVNFSTALSIAVALVAGRLTHEELDPAWLAEHEAEVRELAGRVRLHHDWDLTLRTIRAPLDAGATVDDVPLAAWRRVRRRMHELNMDDDLQVGWRELREFFARPAGRRLLADGVRRRLGQPASRKRSAGLPRDESSLDGPSFGGLAGFDPGALRMTFPCRLRFTLRSGRTVEVEGQERGACGRPVAEQRAVVEEKCRLTGVGEKAWTAA